MKPITYAYLETTNYCNLDCSFCNRTDVIGPLKHMSLENWGKLLDGIKHHPIQEAKLMGMGEPFLHPQFDEVCRMFKETFHQVKNFVKFLRTHYNILIYCISQLTDMKKTMNEIGHLLNGVS
jgi:MoaA/NifB/PqqE/SkfB family radical SAM enzyme